MSGSSAYPGAVDVDQSNVDNVDLVLAADVNDAQKSANQVQIILGQDPVNITDALAGSPLTAPNVVGGFTGATSGSNPSRLNPQVGALSVIATMIRRITGNASWLTSPLASIASILGFKFVTAEAVASLTGSVNISTIHGVGALGSMPAAASANNGWLYLVTSGGTASQPNGALYRSNGSAWVRASDTIYTASTFAAGDMVYYDATNQRWTKLAIGTSGQFLRVTAGVPAWVTGTAAMLGAIPEPGSLAAGDTIYWDGAAWQKTAVGGTTKVLGSDGTKPVWINPPAPIEVTLPAIFSQTYGTWTLYSSIQAAINAADGLPVSGLPDQVIVPPGVYTENLTLKANVPLTELVPGTVEIRGSMLMSANCRLKVWKVRTESGSTDSVAITVTCANPTDFVDIDVDTIVMYRKVDGVSQAKTGIKVTQGTVYARVREWQRYAQFQTDVKFVWVTGGTLYLSNADLVYLDGTYQTFTQILVAGGTAYIYGGTLVDDSAALALQRTSGSLYVYGVQYNRRQVSGVVNQSIGDRASSHFASAAFFNSAI